MTKGISRKLSKGFTLIEIMIVVTIIGILASIAYPSYLDYVRRGHQTEAQGQMMELASALEEHRAKNFTYSGATLSALSPSLAANAHYNAALALGANNQSYTITSNTSSSLMSGMPALTLDNRGTASWDSHP
ncbi:type IV pilus assembly protein PilE [Halopseudomonas litoralis]|uniref:Type IV pilus assembly protein PilE n=1 Tax=Halopseudomonas litoralis TaxID=797277 RepID=A0A1H1TZC8_9GAMM|nr:type IV pilin protein [Halopseudomonas litoralis]SDS65578.1 type IV pilus assembly protein PilE [Halopseudomonas litoralis]